VNWLWLNIPLMAVFFLAAAGIPLWLVLRRPDFGAARAGQAGQLPTPIAARYHAPEVRTVRRSKVSLAGITAEDEAWMRELAGVTR
jgi:hypothetical protein